MVDALGAVTLAIHTTSSGQGHETLAATVAGEVLDIDPDRIRVVRPTSLESLPGNSPVGSRMAIMLGGAVHHAATELRDQADRHRRAPAGCPGGKRALSQRRRGGPGFRPRHRMARTSSTSRTATST